LNIILNWIMNIWYWWVKLVHAYLLSRDWCFFTGRICIIVVFCTSHYLEVTVTSNIVIGNFVIGIWHLIIWCSRVRGLNHLVTLPVFVQCCKQTIFDSKKRMNHWFANRIAYYNMTKRCFHWILNTFSLIFLRIPISQLYNDNFSRLNA